MPSMAPAWSLRWPVLVERVVQLEVLFLENCSKAQTIFVLFFTNHMFWKLAVIVRLISRKQCFSLRKKAIKHLWIRVKSYSMFFVSRTLHLSPQFRTEETNAKTCWSYGRRVGVDSETPKLLLFGRQSIWTFITLASLTILAGKHQLKATIIISCILSYFHGQQFIFKLMMGLRPTYRNCFDLMNCMPGQKPR